MNNQKNQNSVNDYNNELLKKMLIALVIIVIVVLLLLEGAGVNIFGGEVKEDYRETWKNKPPSEWTEEEAEWANLVIQQMIEDED